MSVSTALDNLVLLADKPNPPAIAMQAIPIRELLGKFEQENTFALVDGAVAPRMWLGNKATIAAH